MKSVPTSMHKRKILLEGAPAIHRLTCLRICLALIGLISCNTTHPVEAIPSEIPLPGNLASGDHSLSMTYASEERTYVLHIPPGLDPSRPVPLVLVFHGISLDASEMIRISGFNAQSDTAGFFVVYPEGTGPVRSWNGGHCCGSAVKNNVDDVGFIRTLINSLTSSLPIDPRQVHAAGFSNGAIFTYRLACELSDLIASIGPISATPIQNDLSTCTPVRSVPVLHFHGTADDPNPYNGGETLSGFQFLSVNATVLFWAENNRCSTQPVITTSGSIRHDLYSGCDSGASVELYTIEEGKHAWPGGEAVNAAMGEPTLEISATSLLWHFFESHPLP